MENKAAILGRKDIETLVDDFYGRVRKDPVIGPIFNEVAKVNWAEHLPKICDFWESLLFGTGAYQGRPFPPHIPLDLKQEHFDRWLALFSATVDDHFSGFKADEIKARAYNIAGVFQSNLRYLRESHA